MRCEPIRAFVERVRDDACRHRPTRPFEVRAVPLHGRVAADSWSETGSVGRTHRIRAEVRKPGRGPGTAEHAASQCRDKCGHGSCAWDWSSSYRRWARHHGPVSERDDDSFPPTRETARRPARCGHTSPSGVEHNPGPGEATAQDPASESLLRPPGFDGHRSARRVQRRPELPFAYPRSKFA